MPRPMAHCAELVTLGPLLGQFSYQGCEEQIQSTQMVPNLQKVTAGQRNFSASEERGSALIN